ncbi:MAG TPA: hypothetical protein VEC57_11415 [Candidatus Limnocylindrales bacterium]|nr:hypothetical protein [Candidatus Limnocylindrales bacterium]
MADDAQVKQHLLEQVAETHERFIELMNERLDEVGRREIELYLGVIGKLTGKLENRGKDLRSIAQEMFAEVASLVMAELGR